MTKSVKAVAAGVAFWVCYIAAITVLAVLVGLWARGYPGWWYELQFTLGLVALAVMARVVVRVAGKPGIVLPVAAYWVGGIVIALVGSLMSRTSVVGPLVPALLLNIVGPSAAPGDLTVLGSHFAVGFPLLLVVVMIAGVFPLRARKPQSAPIEQARPADGVGSE